jgi:hypothetical protein
MTKDTILDDWLKSVPEDDYNGTIFSFPNTSLRDDYLATIEQRADEHVVSLLRSFLIPSISLGVDPGLLDHFRKNNGETARSEFRRRLVRYDDATVTCRKRLFTRLGAVPLEIRKTA